MDENTLNDLLECSVCLERLDTSSKVLPCQHTFCRKCLEVIYASRQELRCPECRVLVGTKIDDLPPNVLLMRILEGMKNSAVKQSNTNNTTLGTCEQNKDYATNATASGVVNDEHSRFQHQQQQQLQPQQTQTTLNPQALQQQTILLQNQIRPESQQLSPPLQNEQNQQRRCIVPHAYALYDFSSNESTDLNFKKGDLILLRRKIDSNWYVGQLKGVEGNFPINYVQVVVPLPSSQCVALYDFKMGPNEEEGCLTFKKGTLIQVLRRVDHNWAEGRIGSSIGIFPIAFVELNQSAKQLLENAFEASASNNTPPQQQSSQGRTNDIRIVPPIPCTESTESPASVNTSLNTSAASGPNTNSSSCSSSATNSPTSLPTNASACSSTTTSSLNTLFHSVPNSPQTSGPPTPQHSAHVTQASNSVRLRNNDLKHKRHSLNALLNNGATALSIVQANRHSAEILSVPNDFEHEVNPAASSAIGQTIAAREQQHHSSNLPQPTQQEAQNPTQSSQLPSATPRHNILKTCVQQNMPPSLPWGYLALYPYKPRKNDELELKKGCVYMVTERCLDGWFKGKNWKDISGVFPGNYVTPLRARDQHQLMHSWKLMPTSSYTTSTYAQQQYGSQVSAPASGQKVASQLASNYSVSMRNDLENINARLTLANLTPHQPLPPDLPPRQVAGSPPNVCSQPQVETSREMRDKEAQKEKLTTTGCMSTSSTTSSNTASSASAGLKKLLTHIKSRSKSPGSAIVAAAAPATSIPNNAGQQTQIKSQPQKLTQIAHTSSVTPVHVRSGSCPSQLLHTLPNDQSRNLSSEGKVIAQQYSSQASNYGSQRIKGHKERPSLENSRPTIDSTLRSIYANHMQQQAALMPNKCGLQFQQQISPQANINTGHHTMVVHRKSNSLDASNILQPSPLNHSITATASTSSLAGSGSGAAAVLKPTSVSQSNINAAAIHASATTKSTLNSMNESRFRCVVPYPPNSDVELELQVGDIIFVYRKQKNGWYKGTNSRTYKTGLFPASFVEPDL